MKTVRHWKRSYQCDHEDIGTRGALEAALRCADLPTKGSRMMTGMLEKVGYVQYVVSNKDVFVFRVVRNHH